jgi:TRAP-type mannitol/chloroaromatic compound transport system permease small subunit
MRALKIIDRLNDGAGQASKWLVIALVGLTTFEVVARYVFNAPTIWGYQLTIMVAASLFALTWGYAERTGAHIRVDFLFARMSKRWQAIVDVVCYIILTFPLLTVLIRGAFTQTLWSFRVNEVMSESFWYPPAQPLRIVVLIGACLVFLQFTASFVRRLHFLAKGASK